MDTETKHSKYYYDKDRNMPIKASNDFKPVVNPLFKKELEELLKELKTMLCDKNRKYGNSAFDNIGIFHKGDRLVSINARIDDKLARKMQDLEDEDEDIDFDLLGYLIFRILINRGKL
jgi:hypothetical protein